uniref:SH3 and cysteine-rich domain-containing protein 2 n=1 Tax=Maylandia zebra TaxID=106582 RepID=A0A3P9D907_9CICH
MSVDVCPWVQLQRLKRSLSFKTMMRSKSVENFFQRSYSDARLPQDFITDPPPNPSISSHSPSLSLSPSLPAKPPRPQITHCFQDHIFRKPTNCQHCKHMIVGNSKQALRCKTCKMAAHLWCTSELSQQPCHGKVRNTHTKKAPRMRVDPVYAALRYGTSLAQMSRSSFGSLSESPTRSLQRTNSDCRGEGTALSNPPVHTFIPCCSIPQACISVSLPPLPASPCNQVPKRIEVHSIHTYVALYKFLPQEPNDLELHPGDRVQVTDDSNEEWWKGKCGDKVGFFPANFVQRVRPGERVWRVIQGNPGNRERGHMAVRESQICVGKREEGEVFLKLSSGKKKGLVPADSIEEI